MRSACARARGAKWCLGQRARVSGLTVAGAWMSRGRYDALFGVLS
jgi:hypothetical protein